MNAPALHTMLGGIHPDEHKAESLQGPIETAPLPALLVIPVGRPDATAELLVEPGARVLKGQLLARDARGLGVHAGSSGSIRAIETRPAATLSGLPELCLILETDGEEQWIDHRGLTDWRDAAPGQLLERIADAGISGLGGAGFPTHRKLGVQLEGIDTLILNAAECEPYITADAALLRERADTILDGVEMLRHLTRAGHCLIGIEDNKPEAIAALQAALPAHPEIGLRVIPTRYPSGAERQLIQILTGREVPSGGLPLDIGMVCVNVGTAFAVARAVIEGKPLISRITTLSGAALARPGNVEALIGTPMDFLLDSRGLDREHCSRLIMGGPLMGITLPSRDLPLPKTGNCLIATTEAELPTPPPAQACIRCGLCADACPVNLLPQQLYWYSRSRELDKADKLNLFDCIECGACAWACPSHIPLVQYYRAAKDAIREERAMHARAEAARKRYEFHQQRQARMKALEEKRRKERAALAKQEAGKNPRDAINAALARVRAKKAGKQQGDGS